MLAEAVYSSISWTNIFSLSQRKIYVNRMEIPIVKWFIGNFKWIFQCCSTLFTHINNICKYSKFILYFIVISVKCNTFLHFTTTDVECELYYYISKIKNVLHLVRQQEYDIHQSNLPFQLCRRRLNSSK